MIHRATVAESRTSRQKSTLASTLAARLLLRVRARVERALAALDARDREGPRQGDVMVLQRRGLFSLLEDDAGLLRSWLSRPSNGAAPAPFVEVIPPRQTIDRVCAGQGLTRASLDAPADEDGPARELSREELARAHQQFLESLAPRELRLFAARASTPKDR